MSTESSRPASPVTSDPAARTARPPTDAVRPAAGPAVPSQVGRYKVVRKLGAGGMGTVYLADDPALARQVALKVLPKTPQTPENLVRRFLSEAQTAGRLRHPNIVAVYDSGEADGYLYLAMEYIDGPDLDRLIRRRGPLPPEWTVEIVRQIASALDHAHAANIVHRDIKPSNILLRRDKSATLTDLGLARGVGEATASNITRAGYTVGTVDYMPPEQAKSSRAADVRSDIYALGCTWYHMLTGQVPFPAGDLTNKLRAHAQDPPPDPRSVAPDTPPGVAAVLARMLAKRPEDRHQSPRELLADLKRPALTRQAVSADDLRGLAADGGDFDPDEPRGPGGPAGGPFTDDEISTGSTTEAVTAFSAPAPAPRGNRDRRPVRTADLVRAGVVFALLAVIVAATVWGLRNLDELIDGSRGRPEAGFASPVR